MSRNTLTILTLFIVSIVHRSADGAACCNQPVPTDDCCAAKVPFLGTCLYFWPPCPTAATTTTITTTTTAAPITNSTHPPCVTAGESCAEQGCCAALVCSLSDEICCLGDGGKVADLPCNSTICCSGYCNFAQSACLGDEWDSGWGTNIRQWRFPVSEKKSFSPIKRFCWVSV